MMKKRQSSDRGKNLRNKVNLYLINLITERRKRGFIPKEHTKHENRVTFLGVIIQPKSNLGTSNNCNSSIFQACQMLMRTTNCKISLNTD